MNERKLSASILAAYDRWLRQEERADATREKYLRSIRAFAAWLGGAGLKGAQGTDCTKMRCGEGAWFCKTVESWTVCLTSVGNRALMATSIDNHEIR